MVTTIRLAVTLVFAAGGVIAADSVADAGGSTFDVHGEYLHWDEHVVTTTFFSNNVKTRGAIADGPWLAYLDRRYADTAKIPEGMLLGRVTFRRAAGSFPKARLEFQVPRVPTGEYHLQLCNSPCKAELGDIVGATFVIARTETASAVIEQVDRAHTNLANRISRSDRKMREHTNAAVTELQLRSKAQLDRVLQQQRHLGGPPARDPVPWWLVLMAIAGFPLGAVAGWITASSKDSSRPRFGRSVGERPAS